LSIDSATGNLRGYNNIRIVNHPDPSSLACVFSDQTRTVPPSPLIYCQ
jgi:hypothetical protein